MINNILVVCVGNVCRSPAGERILQQRLPDAVVSSAGIGALAGKPADATGAEVAAENGVSLDGHIARQVTPDLLMAADLILVMEAGHKAAIHNLAPQVGGKVMLAGHWSGGRDIADPYRRSKEFYQHVFSQLDAAMSGWAERIAGNG